MSTGSTLHRKDEKPLAASGAGLTQKGHAADQPGVHEKEGGRHAFPQSAATHEETAQQQQHIQQGRELGAEAGAKSVGAWEGIKQKASEMMGQTHTQRTDEGTTEEGSGGGQTQLGGKDSQLRRRAEPLIADAELAARKARETVEELAGKTQESLHQGIAQAQGFLKRRNFHREDLMKILKYGLGVMAALWALSMIGGLWFATKEFHPATGYSSTGWGDSSHSAADWATDKYNSMLDYMHLREPLIRSSGRSWFGKDEASQSAWQLKDRAAEHASHAYLDALHKAEQAKSIAEQRAREATSFLRNLGYSYAPSRRSTGGIFSWFGNRWEDLKSIVWRNTGLFSEEARHQTNLAMEHARHRTTEAGYAGSGSDLSFGERVKNVMEKLNPMA